MCFLFQIGHTIKLAFYMQFWEYTTKRAEIRHLIIEDKEIEALLQLRTPTIYFDIINSISVAIFTLYTGSFF